ncbi:hypothetical protein [Ornithinimicrobium kibberense]|uniref:hypothetical protein n=1 Tax=Ornithinimicrobium kibberense TaxID=282060 RepID=UPI00360B836A
MGPAAGVGTGGAGRDRPRPAGDLGRGRPPGRDPGGPDAARRGRRPGRRRPGHDGRRAGGHGRRHHRRAARGHRGRTPRPGCTGRGKDAGPCVRGTGPRRRAPPHTLGPCRTSARGRTSWDGWGCSPPMSRCGSPARGRAPGCPGRR